MPAAAYRCSSVNGACLICALFASTEGDHEPDTARPSISIAMFVTSNENIGAAFYASTPELPQVHVAIVVASAACRFKG